MNSEPLTQADPKVAGTGLPATVDRSGSDPAPLPGLHLPICATCGTQFQASDSFPGSCPICTDSRQYVGHGGQRWTTLAELRTTHRNILREQETNLWGMGIEPSFGIGQRALLVQTTKGNVLWDCISLLDDATVAAVKKLGGLAAIAISHPHYYSAMVEWSRAFGGAPIFLHADNRPFVVRPDRAIEFWEGEQFPVQPGLTLIRTGGHFEGFQVLHWADGAEGRGVLLSGDQPYVASDRQWVSFMYSYPNLIPLNAPAIQRILRSLEPYSYDRIYGAWWPSIVTADGKQAVARSAERYLQAIGPGLA